MPLLSGRSANMHVVWYSMHCCQSDTSTACMQYLEIGISVICNACRGIGKERHDSSWRARMHVKDGKGGDVIVPGFATDVEAAVARDTLCFLLVSIASSTVLAFNAYA